MQFSGTCEEQQSNNSIGVIKGALSRSSCASCAPFSVTVQDACSNGSFEIYGNLPTTMIKDFSANTYTLAVSFSQQDVNTNQEIPGQTSEDSITVRKIYSNRGIKLLQATLSASELRVSGICNINPGSVGIVILGP